MTTTWLTADSLWWNGRLHTNWALPVTNSPPHDRAHGAPGQGDDPGPPIPGRREERPTASASGPPRNHRAPGRPEHRDAPALPPGSPPGRGRDPGSGGSDGSAVHVIGSWWWDGKAVPIAAEQIPAGAVVRRLPGTLLPGLTDAHVHTGLVDAGTIRAGGIAGVWDLGGVPARVAQLRDHALNPTARLPRMIIAGPFLTAPGGYPSDRSWAAEGSWREIHSITEAADAVAECATIGARLIKITAHAGGPTLPAKTFAAIVEAAHAEGLRVVVHAEGPGMVEAATHSGADLLAHTPWTEPAADTLLRAAAGMTWISTLDIHGWGTPTPALATAVANLRRFLEYGGTVIYGTDLGNGPLIPGINPREIRALQQAGLTPHEVLKAMTADAPGLPPCWIPGGLDLDPAHFADSIATARVLGPEVHPRP